MADKLGTLLTSIDGFPADAAEQLAGLWITTAEELIAAAEGDGVSGLAEYLNATPDETAALVAQAQAAVPDFAPVRDVLEVFGTGALDEMEGADPADEPPRAARAVPPPSVNLIARMPAVRNQRSRGTCVAHACAGVREFLEGEDSTSANLSEQFLYWACKDRDKWPGEGTWINIAMDVLKDTGVCVEKVWPYNPDKIAGNESQGPPPEGAAEAAADYKVEGSEKLQPRWVDTLKKKLAEDKPVAFSVPVFRYWLTEPAKLDGNIRVPLSSDPNIGGHAMIMVGYQDDTAVPGGGYFIVRNSWGEGWASESDLAAGYARLPYKYIADNGRSAFTITGAAPKPEPTPDTPTPDPKPDQPKPGNNSLIDWIRKLLGGKPQ